MTLHSKRRLAPLALAAAALLGAGMHESANAQTSTQNDLRARTQKRVTALFATAGNKISELNLTATQKSKLQAIAQKNAPLARSIWNDSSLTRQQKMAKLSALKNEARAVLTPAQKENLAGARGDAMGKLFETAVWVSNELDLKPDQQEKIREIVMGSFAQGRTLKDGAGGNFGAIRSLVLDADGKIQKILTPQQQSKWVVIRSVAREEVVKKTRQWRAMNRA